MRTHNDGGHSQTANAPVGKPSASKRSLTIRQANVWDLFGVGCLKDIGFEQVNLVELFRAELVLSAQAL